MITEIICIIILFAVVRAVITRDRSEKMLYINVMSFGLSALIALYIQTPFGAILAVVYFVASTLSSNAIAYTLGRVKNEIILDD